MADATAKTFSPQELEKINEGFVGKSPEEILKWAADTFLPTIGFASSFGAEDVVLVEMIARVAPGIKIFTLDTGRLHDETYEVMEKIRYKYNVQIESYFPDATAVENLEREKGFYSFRDSIENRKECCHIRKVEPLHRALSSLDAWITGLRRDQAVTRANTQPVEIDEANGGLIKVNPLVEWTNDQVWGYIKANRIPYNALHDRNFPSIGCAPCTRAIEPGEDIRAGRWWWELPEYKECGLHPVQMLQLEEQQH
jgi:phosphoadenosine phosphosulfate reductase